MRNQAQLLSLPNDPANTVHTEVVLPDGRNLGFDLLCSEDHMQQFRGAGLMYEPDVMAVILNFVKPGDICIDAGANLGYHSILMTKIIGPTGQVLAFEPDPICYEKLKNNLALNGVKEICFPIPTALWDDNIMMRFFIPAECGYGSFLKFNNMEQKEIQIEAVSLDSIMNPEVPIRLLKLDCEGAEEGILHGAENLLKRGVDAVIVEFNFSISDNDKSIRKYMHSLGYDFFFLFDNGQMPERILPETIIQRGEHRFHFNGLFSKQSLVKDNWKLKVD
jgi:FkbM family methyltransferase